MVNPLQRLSQQWRHTESVDLIDGLIGRKGNGVGVGCIFTPSIVDIDFSAALKSNQFLWFPRAKEIEKILNAMDKSDDKTIEMLPIKSSWGGIRPRKLKVADFL